MKFSQALSNLTIDITILKPSFTKSKYKNKDHFCTARYSNPPPPDHTSSRSQNNPRKTLKIYTKIPLILLNKVI